MTSLHENRIQYHITNKSDVMFSHNDITFYLAPWLGESGNETHGFNNSI